MMKMFYTLIYGCIDVTSGWQIEHPTSNLHSLSCHHYRSFLCASQSLSYSRCWKASTFLTKGINITEAVLTPWIHLTALNSEMMPTGVAIIKRSQEKEQKKSLRHCTKTGSSLLLKWEKETLGFFFLNHCFCFCRQIYAEWFNY